MSISNPVGRPRKPWDQKRTSISITLPIRVLRAIDALADNRSGFVSELVINDPRIQVAVNQLDQPAEE
jgi:hypothetical protein